MSSATPCCLNIPARWPSSTTEVSHRPRWPTAIRNVSSADAGKISHSTAINVQNSSLMDPSLVNCNYVRLGGAPESPGTALLSHEEYPHQPIPPHSIKLSAFQRKFLPGIFAEYSVSRRRKSVSAGQGFDYFFSARCEKPPARSDNHTSVHHCWTPSPRAISRSDRTAIVTQNHPPAIIFREPCQHLSGPLRMLRVRFEHWAKRLNRRKMQDRIDRLGGSKSLGCNGCS